MQVRALELANLRCFEHLSAAPGDAVNLVHGANGSGKTTLLEAISLICLGKSFHTTREKDLIRRGQTALQVRAEMWSPDDGGFNIRIQKGQGETSILRDGQVVAAASVLARAMPSVVIHSRAGDLLGDTPGNRRALLDRTMFHVEHRYVEAWKSFRHAMRQRNELLRSGASADAAAYWHQVLGEQAAIVDAARSGVVAALNETLATVALTEELQDFAFRYNPGWKPERTLAEQLGDNWSRDREFGFSTVGIHRADLVLTAGGTAAARRLSRGQGKYVVTRLLVALAQFIRDKTGFPPIMLVDDLAAELDDKMRGQLVDKIVAQGTQTFFTAIRPGDLPELEAADPHLFHVEH